MKTFKVVGTLNKALEDKRCLLLGSTNKADPHKVFFGGPITPLITGGFPPSELGKIYKVPHKIFTAQRKTLEIRSKFPKNCNPFVVAVRFGTPKMTGIPSQPSARLVVWSSYFEPRKSTTARVERIRAHSFDLIILWSPVETHHSLKAKKLPLALDQD